MKLRPLVLVFGTAFLGLGAPYGGTETDYGSSVQQISDGGYIIPGYPIPYGAGRTLRGTGMGESCTKRGP